MPPISKTERLEKMLKTLDYLSKLILDELGEHSVLRLVKNIKGRVEKKNFKNMERILDRLGYILVNKFNGNWYIALLVQFLKIQVQQIRGDR